MKKMVLFLFIGLFLLVGSGCRESYPLPDKPVAFRQVVVVNPDNKDDKALGIEYNGRIYRGYGIVKGRYKFHAEDCIGYIVMEDYKGDTDTRIFAIKNEDNFLVKYHINGIMEQALFMRATDTREKDIDIPDFIDSLEYEYWE